MNENDMARAIQAAIEFARQIVASGCTLPPPNFGVVAMADEFSSYVHMAVCRATFRRFHRQNSGSLIQHPGNRLLLIKGIKEREAVPREIC